MNIYSSEILGLDTLGIDYNDKILRNLSVDTMVNDIITNNEGKIASNGAAMVDTGEFTGRSPKDKYIVKDEITNKNFWWSTDKKKNDNKPINYEIWSELKDLVINQLSNKKIYVIEFIMMHQFL